MSEIKQALGLGEDYLLPNGSTIKCVPCPMSEIEDAFEHYETVLASKFSLQGLYMKRKPDDENKEAAGKDRYALEWLLIRASGQPVPENDGERKNLAKTQLASFSWQDYGVILGYIARFLGLVAGNAASTQAQEDQGKQQE